MQYRPEREILIMFSNDFATLTHYKDSMKKKVSDFVIRFHSEESDLQRIIQHSFQVVKDLVNDYHNRGKTIMGRLVAFVKYYHVEKEEIVTNYHPSYKTEVIDEADNFYFSHMLKICERMEDFNQQGSNLIVKNIEEVHLHINVIN